MDSAVAKLKKEGVSEDRIDELKAAFELFDTDHSGYITLGKIHTLLNVTFGKWLAYSCSLWRLNAELKLLQGNNSSRMN